MEKYSMDLVQTLREVLIRKAFSILSKSHLQEITSARDPRKQLSLLRSAATPAYRALRNDVFITTYTREKRKPKASTGVRILKALGMVKKKSNQNIDSTVTETIDSLPGMQDWEVSAFFEELNRRWAEISKRS